MHNNDKLHKINEYLLPLSPFVFKVTPFRVASCKTRECHKPNKTKQKRSIINNNTQKFTQSKFYPQI